MATLKSRRGVWYARVKWYEQGAKYQKEKQVPLRTKSKVTARERLAVVNKVEGDIKEGINFKFPWLNESTLVRVKRFTINDAVDEWIKHRRKNKIRQKTIAINKLGLDYMMICFGKNRPLNSIKNSDIRFYIDYLESRANKDTSINIHLRTLKSMMRYYHKMGKVTSVPVIDQRKIPKTDPIYITDDEFQRIMELDWLDSFYKRVFFFYRETGLRLREPFMATLHGKWLDIPPESKSHSVRSIELNPIQIKIFPELDAWNRSGYGSMLSDSGDHLSKLFKKALRKIGADEDKRFHSLRHTFAVRRLLMNTSIYDVKLLMGHSSVTTTEQNSKMNLKRVAQDFPTLVTKFIKSSEFGKRDTKMRDTIQLSNNYMPVYQKIEG